MDISFKNATPDCSFVPSSKEAKTIQNVADCIRSGAYDFFNVLDKNHYFDDMITLGEKLRRSFSHFIIVGTGGSALGAMSLQQALLASPSKSTVFFLDNPDPVTVSRLVNNCDLDNTGVIAISKSGETTETLSILLALQDIYIAKSLGFQKHFHVLTTPGPSSLAKYAQEYNLPLIQHHPKIGGRFSVFSNVGLLPSVLMGIDIMSYRSGALEELQHFCTSPLTHPATLSALRGHIYNKSNTITMNVMMPYADQLSLLTRWYIQLYAESLGKDGQGLTPISAIGTVDQHAQLQLFHDGPKNKWITILRINSKKTLGTKLPRGVDSPGFLLLENRVLGEIFDIEAQATRDSLHAAGLPIREIILDDLDPQSLARLMVFLTIEVIITAKLMDINAFDQPGVEDSKTRIKALLSAGRVA